LWGQSENISISVKDDNRFGGVFPLSVITSNCNRMKIIFGKGFWCHLLTQYQFITSRANMQAKRKCKESITTEPSKSAKRKCRRISVVHHEDTNEVEGHNLYRVSHLSHIANYNYNFRGKKISGCRFFVISQSFNIFEKNLRQLIERSPAPEYKSIKM
jgi:hypothetical protein